ncbi:MAG: hypothetical protein Q7K37_12600, partial [Dehalococcoidia bacterium]|nr:hypothetical protein [Dehalococcoidia bacterium]
MTADYPRLLRALQHELEAGGRDLAVPGGLDGLLREQALDEPPGSALLRMAGALPAHGYASLTPEDRMTWLRRAIATARRELTLEVELRPVTPSPTASSPPAEAKKAPPKRRAPRVATEQEMRDAGEAPRARPVAKSPSAARKVAPGAAALDLPIEQ